MLFLCWSISYKHFILVRVARPVGPSNGTTTTTRRILGLVKKHPSGVVSLHPFVFVHRCVLAHCSAGATLLPKESDLAPDRWDMRGGRSCSWRTFLLAPGAPTLLLLRVPTTTPDWRRVCLGDSVRQLALSVRTHWSVQPQSATARRLRLVSTKRSTHSLRPNGCDAAQKMNPVTCSSAFNS